MAKAQEQPLRAAAGAVCCRAHQPAQPTRAEGRHILMVNLADAKASNCTANLTGKHALCVGGSSGCGKGAALVLSRQGCAVTIIGRDEERGRLAAEEISAASPTGLKCDFISCDVRQFSSIKAVCEKYTNGGQRASLDFLTLSCTRGGIQGFRPTAEGYDERLMTMYLARFGFVHALIPLLLKSEGARVISILSAGKHQPHKAWERDFLTKQCGPAARTFAAGFYNDCAVAALAKLHPHLSFIHIYPGFVNTNWWLEMPPGLRCIVRQLMKTGKRLEDCGEFMAYALLNDQFKAGSFLLTELATAEMPTKLNDDTTCAGVWAKSVAIFEKEL